MNAATRIAGDHGLERAEKVIVLKEVILAQFFEGTITGATLANDLRGSETRESALQSTVEIEDMQQEFVVTRDMAVKLCDAEAG